MENDNKNIKKIYTANKTIINKNNNHSCCDNKQDLANKIEYSSEHNSINNTEKSCGTIYNQENTYSSKKHNLDTIDNTCNDKEYINTEKSCCAKYVQENNACLSKEHILDKTKNSCCDEKHISMSNTEYSCCSKENNTKKTTQSCCSKEHKEKKSHDSCYSNENNKKVNPYATCCSTNESSSCCGGTSDVGCCSGDSISNKKGLIILLISLASLVLSFVINKLHGNYENGTFAHNFVNILNYLNPAYVAIILCGYPIFKSAIKNLRQGKIKSSLLISVAIVASFVLEMLVYAGIAEEEHYLFAAGEIAFLMALGEFIEKLTVAKSRSGIEKIIKLMPQKCTVMRNDSWVDEEVKNLNLGDIVLIKPSEQVTVDGVIIKGNTALDQSSITGESLPIDKKAGDKVFCGTWNKNGVIEVEVTVKPEDSTIQKLINMVEEAEGKKSPIARLADKCAGYIVPLAISISFIVFLVAYFAFNLSLIHSIVRGVTILVVFCPCSLALATPTAIAAGIGNAASKGIIIKSGEALEKLVKTKVVAMDKTGTITEGVIEVDNFILDNSSLNEISKNELYSAVYALEKLSTHPIAIALCNHLENTINKNSIIIDKNIEILNVNQLEGIGIEGSYKNKKIYIASYIYSQRHFKLSEKITMFENEAQGKSLVVVSVDGSCVLIFSLTDIIRQGAKESITEMNSLGYSTLMLTGDNKNSAMKVAESIGITDYAYELLPENKVEHLKKLEKNGNAVCFVGDGVNDAPSLAEANCSIAMGELGSDIAIETSDIIIMNSDIKKVPFLLRFSKRVLNTIKLNIIISMSINFIAVILSTYGLLTPVTGAIVHNISSVLVVLNSSLLLFYKNKIKKEF